MSTITADQTITDTLARLQTAEQGGYEQDLPISEVYGDGSQRTALWLQGTGYCSTCGKAAVSVMASWYRDGEHTGTRYGYELHADGSPRHGAGRYSETDTGTLFLLYRCPTCQHYDRPNSAEGPRLTWTELQAYGDLTGCHGCPTEAPTYHSIGD